tara:strand:- start:647 stop:838 length:192 start_codon:yes stop_codon:yes gene_type:complete
MDRPKELKIRRKRMNKKSTSYKAFLYDTFQELVQGLDVINLSNNRAMVYIGDIKKDKGENHGR